MMENVPKLSSHGRFREFRASLISLGYEVQWAIKDAAEYGVPQRRRRLMMLASRVGPVALAGPSGTNVSVGTVLKGLPKAGRSGDAIHDLPEHRSARIRKLIADIPKDGGSRTQLPKARQLECHLKCDGFKDVYGRLSWGAVAPTITGGCFNPSKGRFLHPQENRAITMREAALLQGFPRGYTFPIGNRKVALARMIGNALPPPFIAAHGRSIRRVILGGGASSSADKDRR
jgi:DNA (cytosine-5)-methyltransferase 1